MTALPSVALAGSASHSSEQREFVRSNDGYDVRYLLAFEHAAFVDYAYLAILDRPADPQGRRSAMRFLEAGGDKVLLLGGIRYSTEGRARAVDVRGLRARYLLHRAYAVPVLGYLLESVIVAITLPRVARRARATTFRIAGQIGDMRAEAARRGSMLEHKLDDEESGRRALLETIDGQTTLVRERLGAFDAVLAPARERLHALDAALTQVQEQIEHALETGRMPAALDGFYAQFEEAFRGSREEIKARVAVYLPKLVEAGIGTADRIILDLGCGRGEWLELLREHGLVSRGIDLNTAWLEELRGRGLDVVEADVVAYLRNVPDRSVGAITGMHIVEHLAFPVLFELVEQARRVLKPGGLVIFETPNPRNVLVASHTFHLDPTHRKPIPSALLQFVLETRGFVGVQVLELHPSSHDWSGVDSEFDRFLIANLFGPQDYAVIARTATEEVSA